jgi:hypothetical protein
MNGLYSDFFYLFLYFSTCCLVELDKYLVINLLGS